MAIHIIFFCRSRILSIQCPPLLRTGWSICPPTFPICIFIIITAPLDDECNPKLFERPASLSGFFLKCRNVVVFQCPLFIFSKCCFGFTLRIHPGGVVILKSKIGQMGHSAVGCAPVLWIFYAHPICGRFWPSFAKCSTFTSEIPPPPIKLVVSFHYIYLISFLKLISVWIDSEPNSCQWNSTLAHWGCHINKRTI